MLPLQDGAIKKIDEKFEEMFRFFGASDRRRLQIITYADYNLSKISGVEIALRAMHDSSAEELLHVEERVAAIEILTKARELHQAVEAMNKKRQRMKQEMDERQAFHENHRRLVAQGNRRALEDISGPGQSCTSDHKPIKISGGTMALSLPFAATIEVTISGEVRRKRDFSTELLEEMGIKLPTQNVKVFPFPLFPLVSIKVGYSLDIRIPSKCSSALVCLSAHIILVACPSG